MGRPHIVGRLTSNSSCLSSWTVNSLIEMVPFEEQFSWISQLEENPNGYWTWSSMLPGHVWLQQGFGDMNDGTMEIEIIIEMMKVFKVVMICLENEVI